MAPLEERCIGCGAKEGELHHDQCVWRFERRNIPVKKSADLIEKPAHYAKWSIEPLEFIQANRFEFWRGNIIKYASRAGSKTYDGMSPVKSEITDLKKVIRYAEVRIQELESQGDDSQ